SRDETSTMLPPRLLEDEESTNFLGQRRVRRDRARAKGGRPPAPVGEDAARLADDRKERRRIPRGEHFVRHHLGSSGGDEQIAIAVAPGARNRGAASQLPPAIGELATLGEPIVGDERGGGLQMSDGGDGASFSVPPAPMARRGDQRLAHRG